MCEQFIVEHYVNVLVLVGAIISVNMYQVAFIQYL